LYSPPQGQCLRRALNQREKRRKRSTGARESRVLGSMYCSSLEGLAKELD
jgi:hypothetical protein